jgi:hypothetical protein
MALGDYTQFNFTNGSGVPLSAAVLNVIDEKLDEMDSFLPTVDTHLSDTSNPHNVTKADVGLADVDNISTAVVATPSTIIARDTNGRASVETPVLDSEIANKGYVDAMVAGVSIDLTGYATETYVNAAVSGLATEGYVDTAVANNGTGTEWKSTHTYDVNRIVEYGGVLYLSIQSANTGNQPDTSPLWWSLYFAEPVMDLQVETKNWTVGTGVSEFKVWNSVTLPAGAKIVYHTYFPHRNDSSSWGGGYFILEYRIDAGAWQRVGNSGYDLSMTNGGDSIGSYSNSFYFDFSSRAADFGIEFRWLFRSYDGTLHLNGSNNAVNGQGAPNAETGNDQFFAHQIIQQVNGVKGERGEAGIALPYDPATTYSRYSIVSFGDKLYSSLSDTNTANEPAASPMWWEPFELDQANMKALVLRHQIPATSNSGTITAGRWNTGPLNYVVRNEIPNASLDTATSEFTLPPGKYHFQAFRSLFYTNAYEARLYDVTHAVTALIGGKGYADHGDGYNSEHVPISGILEVNEPTTYRIEVWPETTRASTGWGFNTISLSGNDAVWSQVTITDLFFLGVKGEKGDKGDPGTIGSASALVINGWTITVGGV